jgi:hypothetical protein
MIYIRFLVTVLVTTFLTHTNAQAEWVSYKENLTINAPQRPVVDRVNRAYYVYVQIDNNSGEDIPSGTRLVVKNSSLQVTNSLSSDAGTHYFFLPAIADGDEHTQKVMFQLERVRLSYEVDLELEIINPVTPSIHLTQEFIGASTAGGCSYNGQHAFKYDNLGDMNWKSCMVAASERGAMVYSGAYSGSDGWSTHLNGTNAMTSRWNNYTERNVNESHPCIVGRDPVATQNDAPLANEVTYDGYVWEFEDLGLKHYDQCATAASNAGSMIISPSVIGSESYIGYWVNSVHMCNTYEYINSQNSYGYESVGSSVRSGLQKCMIGHIRFADDGEAPAPIAKLYDFTAHTFTTCGLTGREGPTLSQCRSTYATDWDDTDALGMNVTGIQQWTVPQTGLYRIVANGAGGGRNSSSVTQANGAEVAATIQLTAGDVLQLLVGQRGDSNGTHGNESGGGGGTFVVTANDLPLIIAGGAGGAPSTIHGTSCNRTISSGHGQTGNSGGSSVCSSYSGTGGTSGDGGATGGGNQTGAAGGGFLTAGAAGRAHCEVPQGGDAFVEGGTGGFGNSCYSSDPNGGFGGGGGGGLGSPGGGGGYSGGASGGQWSSFSNYGGGGGSFTVPTATDVVKTSGTNAGQGRVTITKL